MENKDKEILEAAEKMVRTGGYNAFSFRDIAESVGIKSSSVHYHFPTKADLGAAVAKYYTDKFLNYLGAPEELIENGACPVGIYIKAFRNALTKDKRMCLCGLLGAEVDGLPPKVAKQAKKFFERNIEWLTKSYALMKQKDARVKAIQTLALLEGAMIMSNVSGDIKIFDQATRSLTAQL